LVLHTTALASSNDFGVTYKGTRISGWAPSTRRPAGPLRGQAPAFIIIIIIIIIILLLISLIITILLIIIIIIIISSSSSSIITIATITPTCTALAQLYVVPMAKARISSGNSSASSAPNLTGKVVMIRRM
jgi:hypothetical protein